jgi:hypothetical protein
MVIVFLGLTDILKSLINKIFMIEKSKLTMILIGILIAGVATFVGLAFYNQARISENLNQIINEPSEGIQNSKVKIQNAPVYTINQVMVNNAYDTTLIDEANGNKIIVASTNKLCGKPLDEYVFPAYSNTLFLTPFNPGTDSPLTDIYALDVNKLSCRIMSISEKLKDFGAKILSPDKTMIAVSLEGNARLDLKTDLSKIAVTLPTGQTLNGGSGGLSNFFAIRWVDNNTISYTVFTDTATGGARKPVLGERVITVK